MPIHSNGSPTEAPSRPLEVLCPSPVAEAKVSASSEASREEAREAAALSRPARVNRPPGRPLEQVMRAFHEQRRLEREEGESAGVIEAVLAARGPGSLAADLADSD